MSVGKLYRGNALCTRSEAKAGVHVQMTGKRLCLNTQGRQKDESRHHTDQDGEHGQVSISDVDGIPCLSPSTD